MAQHQRIALARLFTPLTVTLLTLGHVIPSFRLQGAETGVPEGEPCPHVGEIHVGAERVSCKHGCESPPSKLGAIRT